MVAGGAGALGYALGAFLAWLARFMVSRREPWPRPGRMWWIALAVVCVAALIGMTIGFSIWQDEIRDMMGVEQLPWTAYPLMFFLGCVFFLLLMFLGQAWGALIRLLTRTLARWVPPRVSGVVSAVVVVVVTILVVNGVIVDTLMDGMRNTFAAVNDEYDPENEPPTSDYRSGGPASAVEWDDMGFYGRQFVSRGPTVADLTEFNGEPAMQPIRAYAGLHSADEIEQIAEKAADDLVRLGGLDRAVIGVATTTGRGWINEVASSSLEYMFNGDSALVSMQYSTLPSAVSFLVDMDRARRAGLALFDAVDRRIELYADQRARDGQPYVRPKLVVYGESLGTFGGEAAFGSINSMIARTDGALFTGPTFNNSIHGDLTQQRDPGSPEWQPIYREGEHVRFISDPADLTKAGPDWEAPRIVYIQHASDPITWFSPRLLFREPDWLEGERGPDILPAMRWIPIVTFLQVAADMAVGVDVEDGHGHVYLRSVPYSWAAILQPEGWTAEKSGKLANPLVSGG